ncbi:histidine kinase [Paenibacillus doosanensis]|uniref:histidine kinase n=1 Tax=Paenibacillus konkukensis TaxID=2020716 RepID=A0ABY4RW07_9BACL|nr:MULTISPECIES: ATP-binding protein [Paenibacillus]MCS7463874.1 histidine kinase [Paenibacillus doosanensis]UQZ85738.1 Sensor histidine kinase ComP [Paenibacillus konkukensis]
MKSKIFFRIVVLALIAMHAWFGYVTFHYPYLGILLKQSSSGEWIVRQLETDSASLKLNVRPGDVVREIDGQAPDEHLTIRHWRILEQAEDIVLNRSGELIPIDTRNVSDGASTDISPVFGELLCLAFALLLYVKAGHSLSSRMFALVFLNIGFMFACLGASQRGDILGKIAISSLMIALPVIFLHFLIAFLEEKGEIRFEFIRSLLRYLYGFVAMSFLLRLPFYIPAVSNYLYASSIKWVIGFFLLGLSLNFVFLAYVYLKFRKQNSYLSVIIKTILWTLTISFFPFAFLSFVPQLLFGQDGVSSLYTSWFVLFFPISFTYLIMSKQLYDIDLVLRRIVFTTVISVIPSGAIVGLNAMVFQQAASLGHLLVSFIFILMLLSFVMYSLEYFATKLEAVMFPRKYQLQNALKKIAFNLQSISSFRELKEIILVDIVHTLQVFGAAIVFKYNDRLETVIEGELQQAEVERLASMDHPEHPSLLRFEVNRHEEYTSYLIISRKRMNTFLGMEEVHWLKLIISYLAVSLENMHLIGKLHVRLQRLASQLPNEDASKDFIWFRKLMFELQEAERKRIATDLHDTTLQDLFFLKKRFAAIAERGIFQAEDEETMRNIIDYVEIINTNLRQSCFELHPHLLYEVGLIRTIQKVVEHEAPLCPFQLNFSAKGAERIEGWDLDTKRHFFRVVQELLNNAKKHSQATRVGLKITAENENILLFYEDDGIGFNVLRASEAELEIGASGTGMEQMKSRVLYLDGQMNVRTGRGKGLQIWITVPIREVLTA